MSERNFRNIYNLSDDQLEELDKAEEMLESQHLNGAEKLLLEMLEKSPKCIPVLNNLGVLYGKYKILEQMSPFLGGGHAFLIQAFSNSANGVIGLVILFIYS